MGVLFYNLFLLAFRLGIRIAAVFNPKARKWVSGRRGIFQRLEQTINGSEPRIWMHCASLGEFEQGRPLLEAIRAAYPNARILLTFFSPSGYEVRKNYDGADWVFYLPLDGPRTAKRFLDIVNPSLVIFVKYEFWFYYLKKVKYRNIPLLLVSALFWKNMSFFKWYGAMQRKMLSRFDHLFVQDETSKRLLDAIGLAPITSIAGDTRFDRVIEIAERASPIPDIDRFIAGRRTIIAGSTWSPDEQLLQESMNTVRHLSLALIIAPHEIDDAHTEDIRRLFPGSINYSEWKEAAHDATVDVLIIDSIGLLSRLYQYGWVNYIGGGFGKGIHNTLEAAVYGKPILFGPVHHKFREAETLIANGAAIAIGSHEEVSNALNTFAADITSYNRSGYAAKDYVYESRGASSKIVAYIQEKRLLTN